MGNGTMFQRYIGIDYSGAGLNHRSHSGLAVCTVDADGSHDFPRSRRGGPEHWSRENIAKWLVEQLKQGPPTLVGIDHAFSFPLKYFQLHPHLLEGNWDDFLDDFRSYWPTDRRGVQVRDQYIQQVRRMMEIEEGEYRFGVPNWFRLTDPSEASLVFDFLEKGGEVATMTHAGLPWLRYMRRNLKKANVHFWPFDGWEICGRPSVVVEVYPAIWKKDADGKKKDVGAKGNTPHRKDANLIGRWMWEADNADQLREYFRPKLDEAECNRARREGWIFGRMDPCHRDQG